jgi:septal ring-binding cell division protein DamX
MTININDIEAQLVANADEIKTQLADARTERDAINARIRDLVAQEKKAERLAAVIRREVSKQADTEAAVASVAPAAPEAAPADAPITAAVG